tara:strand:+ start:85 stop:348 length:264 start_codon:yes stop_codon:yes gene_type:complete
MKKLKHTEVRVLEKVLLDGAECDPEFALTVVTQYQVFEGVKAIVFDDDFLMSDEHDIHHYGGAYYDIIKLITNDGDYHINPQHIVSF